MAHADTAGFAAAHSDRPTITVRRAGEGAILVLAGRWRLDQAPLPIAEVTAAIRPGVPRIGFDSGGLTGWDTGLLTVLAKARKLGAEAGVEIDPTGLPSGVRRLLALASAVPERAGTRKTEARRGIIERIGLQTQSVGRSAREMVTFVGEATLAFGRLFSGRAQYRRSDLMEILRECGPRALGIVSLISFLVGLILAFVGAVQLRQFGASVYVADLVGIAMLREMAAIMTAIVMAGRTGAAFAAQLGTMQVNEEIDALSTLGISPMEFLVLPRMLALALMMPLLCLYADLVGILGGLVIGIGMLDLGFLQYVQQTRDAVDLPNFAIGLAKSVVFGILVAIAGCLRGMQCGRSASAVGQAATSAVVTGIVLIIVTDAIFAVVLEVVGL